MSSDWSIILATNIKGRCLILKDNNCKNQFARKILIFPPSLRLNYVLVTPFEFIDKCLKFPFQVSDDLKVLLLAVILHLSNDSIKLNCITGLPNWMLESLLFFIFIHINLSLKSIIIVFCNFIKKDKSVLSSVWHLEHKFPPPRLYLIFFWK